MSVGHGWTRKQSTLPSEQNSNCGDPPLNPSGRPKHRSFLLTISMNCCIYDQVVWSNSLLVCLRIRLLCILLMALNVISVVRRHTSPDACLFFCAVFREYFRCIGAESRCAGLWHRRRPRTELDWTPHYRVCVPARVQAETQKCAQSNLEGAVRLRVQ